MAYIPKYDLYSISMWWTFFFLEFRRIFRMRKLMPICADYKCINRHVFDVRMCDHKQAPAMTLTSSLTIKQFLLAYACEYRCGHSMNERRFEGVFRVRPVSEFYASWTDWSQQTCFNGAQLKCAYVCAMCMWWTFYRMKPRLMHIVAEVIVNRTFFVSFLRHEYF